jgi:phenylalanine-4-hydroxylase
MAKLTLDTYRRDYPDIREDFTVPQRWRDYSAEEHAVWNTLGARQGLLLPGLACEEFMQGLATLGLRSSGIPDFAQLSATLQQATGWQVVAVPGLVPDEVFFEHLANRRFPAGRFIRSREQLDYLQEPDIFHDVFGHVPMLMHPVFADYMEAYGKGGLRAQGLGMLRQLARLYWYTVEFGLLRTPEGLRIYGSGIVSSAAESVFSLEDTSPNRIAFDLVRVMRTNYRIDDFQQTYFVIESFEQLLRETAERDFAPVYEQLRKLPDLTPDAIDASDEVLQRGTQRYARARAKDRA